MAFTVPWRRAFVRARPKLVTFGMMAALVITGGLTPFLRKQAVGNGGVNDVTYNFLLNSLFVRLIVNIIAHIYCMYIASTKKKWRQLWDIGMSNWKNFCATSLCSCVSLNSSFLGTIILDGTSSSVLSSTRVVITAILRALILRRGITLRQAICLAQITLATWLWSARLTAPSIPPFGAGHAAIAVSVITLSLSTIFQQQSIDKLQHVTPMEQLYCSSGFASLFFLFSYVVGTLALQQFINIPWVGTYNMYAVASICVGAINSIMGITVSRRTGVLGRTVVQTFALPFTALCEAMFANSSFTLEQILSIFVLSCASIAFGLERGNKTA